MTQNKTGFNPTQTAEDWLERGVHTVPLRSKSKRPKDHNWTHLRLVGAALEKKFKPGDNIGALWGEPSNWAVDLDLDTDEACDVAEFLLPETFTYGRSGKEYSHYVFKCVGAETKKWQTKKLGTLVEIRSTGAQSVIPPSHHPDGGRYFIHDDIEYHTLRKLDLERFGDEIAIAAVFTHHYPDKGSRHDYVHMCTGSLCHAGWNEKKIRRVMRAFLSVVLDDGMDEVKDRLGTVINSIKKYHEGERIKGLTSLEEFMPMDTIMGLRRWLQTGTREAMMLEEPVHVTSRKEQKDKLKFDPEWLEIPGLIGDIAKWANKRAYIKQPVYGLASAITATALASCNNYVVDVWDTPLQPYLMITGTTGSGKDSALRAVSEFSNKLKLDEFIVRGIQSYYAMLDVLSEPPNMLCLTWDEAARNLAAAKNINGPDFQTITHILSLYGAANTILPATPGRKNPIPELVNPFFTLLATAQPETLMEAVGNTAQETGFVNRILLFDTGPTLPPLNEDRVDLFPSSILKHARLMRDKEQKTTITFEDQRTYTRFKEYEEIARRRTARREYTWARSNQNALILAGLAAIGIDPHRPVIDADIATWAMQIVTWSNSCWEDKIRVTGGDTINEKESFKVQKVIAHPHEYLHLAKGKVKQQKLMQKGLMPLSVLKRATRSIQGRRFNEIIIELHDIDLIGSTEEEDNTCYYAKE